MILLSLAFQVNEDAIKSVPEIIKAAAQSNFGYFGFDDYYYRGHSLFIPQGDTL